MPKPCSWLCSMVCFQRPVHEHAGGVSSNPRAHARGSIRGVSLPLGEVIDEVDLAEMPTMLPPSRTIAVVRGEDAVEPSTRALGLSSPPIALRRP